MSISKPFCIIPCLFTLRLNIGCRWMHCGLLCCSPFSSRPGSFHVKCFMARISSHLSNWALLCLQPAVICVRKTSRFARRFANIQWRMSPSHWLCCLETQNLRCIFRFRAPLPSKFPELLTSTPVRFSSIPSIVGVWIFSGITHYSWWKWLRKSREVLTCT